jgi:hypothetical protein
MKREYFHTKLNLVFTILLFTFIFQGCESYLDQSPESNIDPEAAYKDYLSFQGFVDELYVCVPDISKCMDFGEFNIADDCRNNLAMFISKSFDDGNYWAWQSAWGSYFGRTSAYKISTMVNPTTQYGKSNWYSSWYGIRKANQGLANLDKLKNATQEERDLLKGQMLFFRAFFYFTIMKDWGGMPYLEKVVTPADELNLVRLNYRETALKAAADFEAASELLPINWDDTEVGQKTLGDNEKAINKIMALSFLGKNLLYAASPLMNYESTGNKGFDVELCKKAASAFAKAINICTTTKKYSLQPWSSYSDMFYTVSSDKRLPGGQEVIMNSLIFTGSNLHQTCTTQGLVNLGFNSYGGNQSVCANYVKNFGMANGLPIDDPASGFNPTDPWKNRDARFYKIIVKDGDQLCSSSLAGSDMYAELFKGGRHRLSEQSSTGYVTNKYWGLTCNKWDNGWAAGKYYYLPPILRLSDVYLMYAESVLQGYGSPQSTTPELSLSALDAVNAVRDRAGVPNIDSKYINDKDLFMEQLILERAVELAFEGLRWNDLRRTPRGRSDPLPKGSRLSIRSRLI